MKNLFSILTLSLSAAYVNAADRIDFNHDIRPLLSNRCFACHGPDEEELKADLRLDTREGATKDLGGYAALVPGDPEASELLYRITLPADDDDVMPPKGKGAHFSKEEIALITRWIEQDAPYALHWSYELPEKPEVPKGVRSDWPKNEIDWFVLSRMQSEGLEPSPEADRYALARRLSLDLTGLPPSWEEAKAFAENEAPNAYEAYVDNLLAKPSYGERWARVWLDLARYADSAGYADDPPRTIWAFRDYVIRSLNENKPFDQFTIEQIAGDLLENPTEEQIVATAFHRNTLTNNEGGTQDEEFRNVAVVDRVNTTMAVWMGTTMACAQCHTHKYDPLTHAEYFKLFAFFNQSQDADLKDESPLLEIWSDEQETKKAELKAQVAELKKILNTPTEEIAKEQEAWLARLSSEPVWNALQPTEVSSKSGALKVKGNALVLEGEKAANDEYVIRVDLPDTATTITGLRLDVSDKHQSNFVLSKISAKWVPEGSQAVDARYVKVTVPGEKRILHIAELQAFSNGQNVAAKGKAMQSSVGSGGDAARVIDGNTNGDYAKNSVAHTRSEKDPWIEVDLGSVMPLDRVVVWNRTDGNTAPRIKGYRVELLDEAKKVVWTGSPEGIPEPSEELSPSGVKALSFATASATYEQSGFPASSAIAAKPDPKKGWAIAGGTGKPQTLTLPLRNAVELKGGSLVVSLAQQSEHKNHLLTNFSLSATPDASVARWANVPGNILTIIRKGEGRSDDEREKLATYFRSIAPSLKEERAELVKVEKQLVDMKPETTVPVMRDLPESEHRETFVQIRGNYQSLGEQVSQGVPAVFHPIEHEDNPNRLDLAKWLVDEKNPLTARVIANRHWEQLFGTGIVETSEEFGSQGELPSHPELLDWLAIDLQENGWDLKRFLKQIVMSATYRQSSKTNPKAEEDDPYNRMLARGPRFRITAEMVRDQALAVSGLLSDTMYGPPVKPPQPEMGLKAAFGSATDWQTSEGGDRYRRGLYTTWRRSNPYPSMATFDAPNREVCTVRRSRTNTPLQALVTLNDPVYVEAAQALGREMVAKGGESVSDKIGYGLRHALIRQPKEEEVSRLSALYQNAYDDFSASPEDAKQMAEDPLGPIPEGSDAAELAAWTVVCNVILNLDEMFMKR